VLTSEELRVAALEASAKRGKWVARRRVFGRWLGWFAWSVVLPVIGLAVSIALLVGSAFWLYMGHDKAYLAAQKWVQHEFGSFQTSSTSRDENASMIPLTNEATPDLQLDRNLTIKTLP
jgi:hypothetical protein